MRYNMETLVTHNGMFHADDIFAAAVLLLMFPKAKVIRSRDPEVWATADVLFDVGGLYDPSRMCFDHHQVGGAGQRSNSIPYASFGLVWKEFGEKLAGFEGAKYIDKKLVAQIDALDNGLEISVPKFDCVREYNMSDFFHSFIDHSKTGDEYLYNLYMDSVGMAKALLDRESRNAKNHERGVEKVRQQISDCIDKSIVILSEYLPWKDVLVPIKECFYVIYPRTKSVGNPDWIVQAVPENLNGFGMKKPLPEAWAGKTDEDLIESTGVADAIFCHNKRFIAVTKSREGAIKLAHDALTA